MDQWKLDTPLGDDAEGTWKPGDAPLVQGPPLGTPKAKSGRSAFLLGTLLGLIVAGSGLAAWGISAGAFDSGRSDSRLTANALMDRINAGGVECREVRSGLERPVYSYDWGACMAGGERVGVMTFATSGALKAFSLKDGNSGRTVVKGSDWWIRTDTKNLAGRITKALATRS
jgi:hypothetical protein